MLELHVLGSGKKGCCYAVRAQGTQEFVCVDCGLTAANFVEACSQAHLGPFKLQAFLITHAHGPQVKGLSSTLKWLNKRGVNPPVYVAPSVLEASHTLKELPDSTDLRELEALRPLDIERIHVLPFRTFHDNEKEGGCYNFRFEEAVGTQVHDAPDSMTILSDAGVVSKQAASALEHARLIAVECNYDTETLRQAGQAKQGDDGKPSTAWAVKVHGNFSNDQAATVVRGFAWEGLRDVVAMHLSATYNAPELAIRALEKAVRDSGCDARVACASADEVVSVLPREVQAQTVRPAGDTDEGGDSGGVQATASMPTAADNPAPAPAAFEDILPLPQALEVGLVSAEGLLATWEAQGHTCNPTPDELIDALAAFGLLDAQDLMPTEAGVAAGIWVAFDPDDPAGALRPVFSLAQAGRIREAIEG